MARDEPTVNTSVRLPESLREKLDAARQRKRFPTLSAMIVAALEEWVEEHGEEDRTRSQS